LGKLGNNRRTSCKKTPPVKEVRTELRERITPIETGHLLGEGRNNKKVGGKAIVQTTEKKEKKTAGVSTAGKGGPNSKETATDEGGVPSKGKSQA